MCTYMNKQTCDQFLKEFFKSYSCHFDHYHYSRLTQSPYFRLYSIRVYTVPPKRPKMSGTHIMDILGEDSCSALSSPMTDRCALPRETWKKQMVFIFFELTFSLLKRIPKILGWDTKHRNGCSHPITLLFVSQLHCKCFFCPSWKMSSPGWLLSCLSDVLFFLGHGGLLPLASASQRPVHLCLTITLNLITVPFG